MATFVKARRAPARGDGRTDLRRLCWWSRPLPLATSLGSVFGHDSPFGRADRPSFKVISTAGAIVALL